MNFSIQIDLCKIIQFTITFNRNMYHGICMCNNTLLKYSDGLWCCKSTTEQCLIDDPYARQFISLKFNSKISIKTKGLLILCIRF